ncbi:hypothetical protein HDK90DRAFT_462424 [Phyllosticta capitalensis]|uniref:Uncharacterized protein n=1 Tax=Phyllosticta capitalensis TaxID=121624 RepID=A0ABR1YYC1_9PEZI
MGRLGGGRLSVVDGGKLTSVVAREIVEFLALSDGYAETAMVEDEREGGLVGFYTVGLVAAAAAVAIIAKKRDKLNGQAWRRVVVGGGRWEIVELLALSDGYAETAIVEDEREDILALMKRGLMMLAMLAGGGACNDTVAWWRRGLRGKTDALVRCCGKMRPNSSATRGPQRTCPSHWAGISTYSVSREHAEVRSDNNGGTIYLQRT